MVCTESLDILYIPRYQNGQNSSQWRRFFLDHQNRSFSTEYAHKRRSDVKAHGRLIALGGQIAGAVIQVQCGRGAGPSKPLDQSYRTRAGCLFRMAGLVYQIRGALV